MNNTNALLFLGLLHGAFNLHFHLRCHSQTLQVRVNNGEIRIFFVQRDPVPAARAHCESLMTVVSIYIA